MSRRGILLLVACCLIPAAVHSAQIETWGGQNIFDVLPPIVEWVLTTYLTENTYWRESVLSDQTAHGWHPDVDGIMLMLKSEMCPVSSDCTSSMFLGCNCMDGFHKHLDSSCRSIPCGLWTFFYHEGARLIKEMMASVTTEQVISVWIQATVPIKEMLCNCNEEAYDAIENCIVNYDGILMDSSDPQYFGKRINFAPIKHVFVRATATLCPDNCIEDLGIVLKNVFFMFDSSLNPDSEECTNYRQTSGAVVKNINRFLADPYDYEGLILGVHPILKSLWCDKGERCSDALTERFNGCCTRHAINLMDKSVVKALFTFLRDPGVLGDSFPVLQKKTINTFWKMLDPHKLCPEFYNDYC